MKATDKAGIAASSEAEPCDGLEGELYAAARRPETIGLPGVTRVRLDVTDPAQITAAAELAKDVTLLVNNAGTQSYQRLVDGDLDAICAEMETILFGPLQLTRAFAPHLPRNGDGAKLDPIDVVNIALDGVEAGAAEVLADD